MNMENNKTTSRRNIVKGAVWSAPVVLATSQVPVYAASVSTNTCVAKTVHNFEIFHDSKKSCTSYSGQDIVAVTSSYSGDNVVYTVRVYVTRGSTGGLTINVNDMHSNQDFIEATVNSTSSIVIPDGAITNVDGGQSSIVFSSHQELPENSYIELKIVSVSKPEHNIVSGTSTDVRETYGISVTINNTPKTC